MNKRTSSEVIKIASAIVICLGLLAIMLIRNGQTNEKFEPLDLGNQHDLTEHIAATPIHNGSVLQASLTQDEHDSPDVSMSPDHWGNLPTATTPDELPVDFGTQSFRVPTPPRPNAQSPTLSSDQKGNTDRTAQESEELFNKVEFDVPKPKPTFETTPLVAPENSPQTQFDKNRFETVPKDNRLGLDSQNKSSVEIAPKPETQNQPSHLKNNPNFIKNPYARQSNSFQQEDPALDKNDTKSTKSKRSSNSPRPIKVSPGLGPIVDESPSAPAPSVDPVVDLSPPTDSDATTNDFLPQNGLPAGQQFQNEQRQRAPTEPSFLPMRSTPYSQAIDGVEFDGSRGHRGSEPTFRHTDEFEDTSSGIDDDTQYPKFSEILATGRYFASAEALWIRPNFNGNASLTIESPGLGQSNQYDYSFTPAFQINAGFLSEYGPGFGANYFQIDTDSKLSDFTSDGIQSGTTRVYSEGSNSWTEIVAANAGESLQSHHSIELHSFGVSVFKALKFKRASLTGTFGIRSVRLNQSMTSTLLNSGGAPIASLTHSHDFAGFGPTFGFRYTRRVGHTSLKVLTSITNSVLFGNRDQSVSNTFAGEFNNFSSNEVIAVIDLFSGFEARKMVGEKRYFHGRLGFTNEAWIGGGTAIDPRENFGFQGVSFTVGYNR